MKKTSYGATRFVSDRFASLEDKFGVLDYAYTKAKDNKNKISLSKIYHRYSSSMDELLHLMRSKLGKELFKEVVGGDGIYFTINAKYIFVPASSMHSFIRCQVFSTSMWE